jgi:hypothetical protein
VSRFAAETLSIFLALAAAAAAPTTRPAEEDYAKEQKLLDELYGPKIAEAKASATPEDDLGLVKLLVTAADDKQYPAKLRYVMARTALDLALPLSGEEAMGLADQALEVIDSVRAMSPLERARLHREAAWRKYEAARARGGRLEEVRSAARSAAEGHLRFGEVVVGTREAEAIDEAMSSLVQANGLIRTFRLAALVPRHGKLTKQLREARDRALRLKLALARVEQAEKHDDAKAVKAARRAVALIYLTLDGDLAKAAEHIAGTGDPNEAVVLQAAKFLKDPTRIDTKTALDTVAKLTELCRSLAEAPQRRLAECAYRMTRAYLATEPKGVDLARARLRELELKGILKITATDNLIKTLRANYKPLHCEIEPLEDGGVRATYDFSAAEQGKDWAGSSGKWAAANDCLLCQTEQYGYSSAVNKLLFRADKPFKVSFRGKASYRIVISLDHRPPGQEYVYWTHYFRLDRYYGLRSYTFGQYWTDSSKKLAYAQPYSFEVTGDGKGGFTWSINGHVVRKLPPPSESTSYVGRGTFQVRLGTRWANRFVTAFDDVVIEGAVVANPK